MKSIYINQNLHTQLKTISVFERISLIQLVQKILLKGVREKLDDLKTEDIASLAMIGKSFEFLNQPSEDIYSSSDGKAL